MNLSKGLDVLTFVQIVSLERRYGEANRSKTS
jgi:hypothetical protein